MYTVTKSTSSLVFSFFLFWVAKTQLIHWTKRVVGTWLSSHLGTKKLSRTVADRARGKRRCFSPGFRRTPQGSDQSSDCTQPFSPLFFSTVFKVRRLLFFKLDFPSQFNVSFQFSASLLLFLSILGFLVARSLTPGFFKSDFNSISYFKNQCPISNRTSSCGRLISDWKSTQENFFLAWTFKKIQIFVCRFCRLQLVYRLVIHTNPMKRQVLLEGNIRIDGRTGYPAHCICFH